ncbi:MAG TPA: YetF domain-containing protein [Thermoanaerobaculia bacterium]|nr:YetF domain-containing protein [Thermoanaerobaculia bacterium]
MNGLGSTLPSIGLIVLRTAVVYVFVLAGFRLLGKRTTGQMTPFDLTLLLLLANAVQNAMVGPDSSLVGGLAAAAVLLVLNATVGRLARRKGGFGRLLRGRARLLVNRGILVEQNLADEGISHEELMQALREHGIATPEEVRLAVLEVDGTISVLRNDDVSAETHKPHRRFRFRKTS